MADSIQAQLQAKIQSELGISSDGKFEAIIGEVMSTYIAAQIAPLQQQINGLSSGSHVTTPTGSLSSGSIHIVPPQPQVSGSGGGSGGGGGGPAGAGADSGGNNGGPIGQQPTNPGGLAV